LRTYLRFPQENIMAARTPSFAIAGSLVAVAVLAAAPEAMGQASNISATNKYAWGENVGFINFRDAGSPSASQGVRTFATFMSGYAWGENIGWINFGDGTPANGSSYANPTSGSVVGVPDFGVNRDAITGNLSGYAWGENVGWINFSGGALATPAQPARIDNAAHRLRGYAWGENIGWINLDSSTIFVGTCPADFNGNGTLEIQDIFDFLNAWFAGSPAADFSGGGLAVQDIFDFLNAWFAGC
jgi:hypothetical protein